VPALDYFVTLLSPFSYLGHERFLALAKKHAMAVRFQPVRVGDVFKATGGVPLAQRAPARQRYRLLELQRWRETLGLPLNLKPKFFPANPERADRAVIAIAALGADPATYMQAMFRALWVEDRDIADEATIAQVLASSGHDAQRVLKEAAGDAVGQALDANTAAAISLGLPGVPGYARDGEIFWGQDRLELLERAVVSGRPAFATGPG
jgi:2-hydroxychromene-2-carboxylate isomerase